MILEGASEGLESGVIVQVKGDRGLPDSTGQGALGKTEQPGSQGLGDLVRARGRGGRVPGV